MKDYGYIGYVLAGDWGQAVTGPGILASYPKSIYKIVRYCIATAVTDIMNSMHLIIAVCDLFKVGAR